MKASTIRAITSSLPIPATILRRAIKRFGARIEYPSVPVVVPVRNGLMEIRDCKEFIQETIYFLGWYELKETRLFERLLRSGDVVVDVGGNIGWFTLLASRLVGSSGRIVSFEPSTHLYSHLQRTVQLNDLMNVTAERVALADRESTATLLGQTFRNMGLGNIVGRKRSEQDLASETVKTLDFDTYCARAGIHKIRLIKIDVEGAELKVLNGMQEILRSGCCDYLLIEVGDDRLRMIGSKSSDVFDLLRSFGYRFYTPGMFFDKPMNGANTPAFANVLACLK